jgi:phosphatidate phosphatase APP1
VIEQIMADFGQRRFILIGDSGEHDPEIYGDLARKHGERVAHIYIRNVTGESRDGERMTNAFRDLPEDRWTLFEDAGGLTPK